MLENYAGEHGVVLKFINDTDTMFKNNKFNDYKVSTFCAKVVYDYKEQMTLILEDINEFYHMLCSSKMKSFPKKKNAE